MVRASSLAFLLAAVALAASPAIAKPTIQTGKNTCTTEIKKKTPAPKTVRFDDLATRITSDAFIYTLKLKNADDSDGTMICTFNLSTNVATLAAGQ